MPFDQHPPGGGGNGGPGDGHDQEAFKAISNAVLKVIIQTADSFGVCRECAARITVARILGFDIYQIGMSLDEEEDAKATIDAVVDAITDIACEHAVELAGADGMPDGPMPDVSMGRSDG
jgi:hypothetical protein